MGIEGTQHNKTSLVVQACAPLTSFHPVSSWASSLDSSWLYLVMSRARVRSMIIATIPERKRTIMTELMIENQWIWKGRE